MLASSGGTAAHPTGIANSPYNADRLVQAPRSEEEIQDKEASISKFAQAVAILEMLLAKFSGKLEVGVAKRELASADISRATYEIDAEGDRFSSSVSVIHLRSSMSKDIIVQAYVAANIEETVAFQEVATGGTAWARPIIRLGADGQERFPVKP